MSVDNNLTNDELVITHVASYSENKNQLFSLEVLKELLKLHKDIKLNLVGASGVDSYYDYLIEYIHNNNLMDRVSLIKRSDNVERIYGITTFCIIPSFSEGLSLVAIEAQACGINVFASTNVPSEVDCGGAIFFDLSKGAAYWAEEIYKLFLRKGNKRVKYDVSKFSFDRFKKELGIIY